MKKTCYIKWPANVFALLTITLSSYLCSLKDPIEYSFSEIGRNNFGVYTVWSISIAIAIILNMNTMYNKVGKTYKTSVIMMYSGLASFILTYISLYYYYNGWFYFFHLISGFLSSTLLALSLIIVLVYIARKKLIIYIILAINLITLIGVVVIIIITDFTSALYQIIPVILCLVTMMLINNTNIHKIKGREVI